MGRGKRVILSSQQCQLWDSSVKIRLMDGIEKVRGKQIKADSKG